MRFENIIGNEKVKAILNKTIDTNSILHSYIFSGIDSIGKKMFAKEFAKSILCTSEENKPCGKCKSCVEFENDNNLELNIIEPDGNTIKIDQIRLLQEKIYEKPIISNKKVYIINNSELMNTQAQNCFLKTLEEPPEFAVIILITSNENNLLSTIKSRCIKIKFDKVSNEEIEKYIKKNQIIENITKQLIDACEGSIGKANKLAEKIEQYQAVDELVEVMKSKSIIDSLVEMKKVSKYKDEIIELLDYMNVILMKKIDLKKTKCIEHIEEVKSRILRNCNYEMTLDYLVLKVWEEINENNSRS